LVRSILLKNSTNQSWKGVLGTPVNGPDFEPALALQKGQDIAVEILCTFDDHKVTGVGVKNEPGSFDWRGDAPFHTAATERKQCLLNEGTDE